MYHEQSLGALFDTTIHLHSVEYKTQWGFYMFTVGQESCIPIGTEHYSKLINIYLYWLNQ